VNERTAATVPGTGTVPIAHEEPASQAATGVDPMLLKALEQLLAIEEHGLSPVLARGAQILKALIDADDVGIFLYETPTDTLVAIPSSQSIARRQHAAGFDRLPLGAGGLAVRTFRSGQSYLSGDLTRESDERQDVVAALGVASAMFCLLYNGRFARGVVAVLSTRVDRFSHADLQICETVTSWFGLMTARAEHMSGAVRQSILEGRRLAAEELRRLTRREQEIVALVASGLTNKEIAARLFLAPGTVSNHVEHILRKLHLSRRSQIATWSVEHGLSTAGADELRP
jgi:DNA-binding CsgD family transcriptional regulator